MRLFIALLRRCRRGAALVEFAMLLPLMAMLLVGVLAYGQYFMIAHSVQQLANDAARSTVAGLSQAEHSSLAQSTVTKEASAMRTLDTTRLSLSTAETTDTVTVIVRFDTSVVPLIRTAMFAMPAAVIERRAVVRPGGWA